MSGRARGDAGVRGCGCGHETLGSDGASKTVDGVEHRWGKPCRSCGGAGVDAGGRDTCSGCRGHGETPAPCRGCGELAEAEFCSLHCAAKFVQLRRPR